jgi:hypothetical protein
MIPDAGFYSAFGIPKSAFETLSMHKPVITIALAYLAGLLLGHGFLYFPFSVSSVLVVSLLAAGNAAWFGKISLRQYFIGFIPGVVCMTAYVYAAAWFPRTTIPGFFTLATSIIIRQMMSLRSIKE